MIEQNVHIIFPYFIYQPPKILREGIILVFNVTFEKVIDGRQKVLEYINSSIPAVKYTTVLMKAYCDWIAS
jgi:hypothetical protein